MIRIRNFQVLILLMFAHLGIAQDSIRVKESFNNDWLFMLGDSVDYAGHDFEDANWRKLTLPHDWSIEGAFSADNSGRNAFLPGGIAWYRKHFILPNTYKGKHIEIQFDGVYKNASIWINNTPVGTHHDGYTSFYYDVTELLKHGESNTIAVRVDNSIQPNCRWYTGSGIHRNVWLTVTNNTHVANWGTYITSPQVSKNKASIQIETSLENMDEGKTFQLETVIYNPQGVEVSRSSSEIEMGRYCKKDFTQTLSVAVPQLWSVQNPVLYAAKSFIKQNGNVLDVYESTFGIRTLVFDAEKGFFLNGENIKMKGVCLHHDGGPLGAVVPDAVWERRLQTLKDIGCNAIRTAHNPSSSEFLDLCDRMGFLVMNEFVDKWDKLYRKKSDPGFKFYNVPMADPNFSLEWKSLFAETIRRDRNHPSVIIWSVGNENHSPGTLGQKNGLRNYASFVRSMDPTRPVISGMERGKDLPVVQKVSDIIETCTYMDLIALNYGEQWCKLIDAQKPGKPYVSTESYTYFNSELEKRFANIERSPWIDVLENNNNMGLFLWVGIDYLGESRTFPKTGSNSGLLDMAGFRKNPSYLYEAFWSDKPMVHIKVYEGDADDFSTSGRWGWPPMNEHWNYNEGDKLDVVNYTNCESVNLYLNNKLIGNQKLADIPNWIMKWRKLNYQSGTLKAVGIIDGKEVCEHTIKTAKEPQRINIKLDKQKLVPDDIIHVELQLTDKKGNAVRNSEKDLHFAVLGAGEIIGIHNGDVECVEPNSNISSRSTHLGRCLLIIKTNNNSNQLAVEVSGDGLKSNSIKIAK
ncbi:glycoside hydrolase family 2 TIM barrel-domain containing protein [Saccharicrinis aurantiacus]|uniref:glycoside hydrolase family 2 TIM barrel-domain containing protein n=1 Tax=Saccharicrinis aurantiacus TaxID=1849719 RepID=UPI0011154596|nr:glycoside hydrolase family 2 TIM barrel-domain containing protein [Saccharicrinis aurantiacus]